MIGRLADLGVNKVQAHNESGPVCYGRNTTNAILGVIVGAGKAIIDIFKGLWDLIVVLTTDH